MSTQTDWRFLFVYHLDQPSEVSVETLTRCNAACTFCPYPTLERIGTKMPDEMIYRLIDEMAEWTKPFIFAPFKVNDPLLDVRMPDICGRFLERCAAGNIRMFTNGSPLTAKQIDWLAALPRLKHLWISLNDYRPKEYEALMGIPFDRTARNIDALHERAMLGEFPHEVVLSTVGFPNEKFRWYCQTRWPRFKAVCIKKDAWLGYTDAQVQIVPKSPCIRWFELSVMADGKVAHCCMHDGADPTYNIGDLNQQTLLEVYNASRWRDRRVGLVSRRTLDETSPCARCTY